MRTRSVPAIAAVALASICVACAGGGSDKPSPTCVPATETCNGVDDDCDGVADEPGSSGCTTYYEDADGDGYGGASACLCAPAAPYTATVGGDCDDANSAVHPGATEACNGIDDDCDALVDEGIAGCCTPSAVEACGVAQGVCKPGTSTCGADFAWGPCLDAQGAPVTLPGTAAETCDGLDDDCDGIVDDVPGVGTPCSGSGTNTTGACRAAWACSGVPGPGPAGLTCTQLVGPTAETCNGIDDDCNGTVDDNPTDVGGPCCAYASCSTQGTWACASGTRQCVGSAP